MSTQEKRNEIIRENIPLLIKELTGLPDDDENQRSCEQLALSIIRNHRNLSTNSHEVRRKIEGIQEKFEVDNQTEYAEQLGKLCEEIIQHPLCVEHYEVDVHWSLLDFLLTLTYNPTGALRRNKEKIERLLEEHEEIKQGECVESETDYWHKILQEDFIPIERFSNSSSELSSWSNDSQEDVSSCADEDIEWRHSQPIEITPFPPRGMENIKPPIKSFPFKKYDSSKAEERLLNTVQHSWWTKSIKKIQPHIESTNKEANFALEYYHHNNTTKSHRLREEPETATEYCLLREIFWMFQVPQTCKFFHVNNENITVRKNVTLTSTRAIAIVSMLEEHFLPYIRMMQDLRNFGKLIYASDDYTPPNTLEHYAASLELLLEPIWNDLLACERELLLQADCEINTVISLHHKLQPTFVKLAHLHNIHQQAIVSTRQLPAHIASVHLLAALVHCNRVAITSTEANLAMSLFLATVKVFLMIADTWWTEGRLDDWHNEFIIERIDEQPGQSIRVREYSKNKEKAFFVPTQISKMITENSFFQLLLEHSLEAGCTLNLLYEINRIGELRTACGAIEDKLYDVFIEDVLKYVRILQKQIVQAAREAKENDRLYTNGEETKNDDKKIETNGGGENVDVVDTAVGSAEFDNCYADDKILKKLTTNDDFLLLAFTMNMNLSDTEKGAGGDQYDAREANTMKNAEPTALAIFEQFEQSKHIFPLEEVVLNALSRILKTRIAFANTFVMRLYREEFDILKHLRNIRKIYLLEASDIMHQFYSKLFKQIEFGDEWANAFLLSTQLDDIICAKFLDMSSLFRIDINSAFRCKTVKVYEAVDELSLSYNLSTELGHMIKEQDLDAYNKVFRFLLKVKWGLTTLENLTFPRSHKRKIPYAPFEMVDLLMRRLEQLRFWMLFAMQSIHFHLMTHVLQSMGEQLDEKILKCTNLKEMVTVHRSYMNTVCEHCFLADNFSSLKLGVEQLLNLTYILRLEWNSCVKYIESNPNHPLAVVDVSESNDEDDYVTYSQIDAIELTYIRCHQYLANKLNNEVYIKHNSFLLGLSTAFNTSLPY
ncbi:gamma-tubulin complex component 5 [Eurosta solidaginis]|uniref:gamma-tubulin complex component 5 n=1 Tax=Eurosta solidaginis TaxID=178769 RepID=UPI00353109BD